VKYLLDTDHISVLQQQSGADFVVLSARIAQHPPTDLGLSIVSFHEQMLGCHTYILRSRNTVELSRGYRMLSRLLGDYSAIAVLPFDAAASAVLDDLQARRVRIGAMDLRISSIAISRGLILVTRNARDFQQVPNLLTEDWTI
jgi:tRNA(fMet)-specific endonuclease VapC